MSSTITGTQVAEGVFLDMAAIRQALEPILAKALEHVGEGEEETIEQAISIPVERDFAGRVIKRSSPGQPPRMDEDILHGIGIEHHVVTEEGWPTLYLVATRPPQEPDDDPDAAEILEFGGVGNWGYILPRPFMYPAVVRLSGYAAEMVGDKLMATLA